MKKQDLSKLALLGITTGLLIAYQNNGSDLFATSPTKSTQQSNATNDSEDSTDPNSSNLGYHLMTEDELILELNPKGEELYTSLTEEGKALARKVASMRCNGTNVCKGLNACKTDKHDCAGLGLCAGQGKCAFSDKNLAVKIVAKKMQEKRENIIQKK